MNEHTRTIRSNQMVKKSQTRRKIVFGEAAMEVAAANFARQLIAVGQLQKTFIILSGELGAGKTTFCRGFVRACGHCGAVKSPTYTLLEEYQTPVARVCHLDLYRFEDAEELEYIGFRDLLDGGSVMLVEWPERVPELKSIATSSVNIQHRDAESRIVTIVSPWQNRND